MKTLGSKILASLILLLTIHGSTPLCDASPRGCARYLSYGVFLELSGPQGFARLTRVSSSLQDSAVTPLQKMPPDILAQVSNLDAQTEMTLVVEVAGITRPEFSALMDEFQHYGVVVSNPHYVSIAASTFYVTANRKKLISLISHPVVTAVHAPLDESAPSDSSLYTVGPQGFVNNSQVSPLIQPPLRTVEQKLSTEVLPRVRALLAEKRLVVDVRIQGLGRLEFEKLIDEFTQNGVTVLEPIYNGYDNSHLRIQAPRHTLIHALSHPAITSVSQAF